MPFERLQDLNLPLYLAFLDWLEYLDHHCFIFVDVHAGVDLRVFSFADLGDDLVVIDVAG